MSFPRVLHCACKPQVMQLAGPETIVQNDQRCHKTYAGSGGASPMQKWSYGHRANRSTAVACIVLETRCASRITTAGSAPDLHTL